MSDYITIAEKAVKVALKQGVSDCDVVVANTQSITAEIEKGSVKQASTVSDPGVGIRCFKGGSSGFAYCTGHDPKAISRTASLAASLAAAGTPDPDFKGLPAKCVPKTVSGLFDKRTADIGPEDAVGLVMDLTQVASDDKRIYSVNAAVSAYVGQYALVNSNGFAAEQKITAFDMFSEAVAKDGQTMFSGYDFRASRRFDKGYVACVGESSRQHALMGLSQTKIETGDYPIILDPLALGWILAQAIGGGANAESIQRNRSYLVGKLGKKIASPSVSISDDPTVEWALGSTSFDGEGTPAKRKMVVDKGTLGSYLYDSYAAGKDKVESTGNSSRGGAAWSYRRPPSISITNLVLKPQKSCLDEMISETKDGVYLRATFDQPNLTSGEFSGLMMESYRVKKGELGPSVRQSTVGIGMVDMLSRVDMIGAEQSTYFGVSTPAVRISKARVGGSA